MDDKDKIQERLKEISKSVHTRRSEKDLFLAINQCSELIQENPDCWEAYRLRASLHDRKKQLDEAIQDFNKTISLCPDDHPDKVNIYAEAGLVLLQKEEYENIGDVIKCALLLNPKHMLTVLLLGQVVRVVHKLDETETKPGWLDIGFIEEAIKRCEEQMDFDDEGYPSHLGESETLSCLYSYSAGLYSEQGDHQKVIDKCKKSIKYSTRQAQGGRLNPFIHRRLAFSYLALGQYKEALMEFDKVSTRLRSDPEVIEGRSESLLKLIEKQEKDFRERLETFLEGPDSIFDLREKFVAKEKEYDKLYRGTNNWLSLSLFATFVTISTVLYYLLTSNSESVSQNSLSILPYLGVALLVAAVPAWWTRILLRSRDRWLILREDSFRKAAIMQYIKATGGNEDFRNQIILETIKHLANRSGADLLAGSQTDDHGMPYSIPDAINKTLKRRNP